MRKIKEEKAECKFYLAWIGVCNKPATSEFCKEHSEKKCECGKQAIGQCDVAVSMVCGRPTCSEKMICHYHQEKDSVVW